VAVLDVRGNGIAGITVFVDPALVERFTLLTSVDVKHHILRPTAVAGVKDGLMPSAHD
jgi:hypothetical protein